jgi:flagellar biosynthesis protein FlhF
MPVVLSNLKDALGSDAIILANRRVGDHIEIIATGTIDEASIDSAVEFQPKLTQESIAIGKDSDNAANGEAGQAQISEELETTVSVSIDNTTETDNQSVVEEEETQSKKTCLQVEESATASASIDALESESQPFNSEDLTASVCQVVESAMGEGTASLTASIAAMVNSEIEFKFKQIQTTLDQRLSQLEVGLWGERDPIKTKHLQTLLGIGLGAELAANLVNRVGSSTSFDEAMRQSLADLSNTLPVAYDRSLTHDGITFVTGPSGSGKTTTLLKLAAQKAGKDGADSVAIISADTQHMSGFDSFAAQGMSLGVSVVVASSPQELKELLKFYSNKQLILVDQSMGSEFQDLLTSDNEILGEKERTVRQLLVLPATVQSSVAESIAADFINSSSTRCVITNLDRPCRVGELFTTIIRNNLRVSYWSECSDIHKPLNRADAQTMVATAVAMGKRLPLTEDNRYLMDLIHPRLSAPALPSFNCQH